MAGQKLKEKQVVCLRSTRVLRRIKWVSISLNTATPVAFDAPGDYNREGINCMMENNCSDDLEAIAAGVFSRHGIDFVQARRAGGWTNAVWLSDELVLRISTRKEDHKLLDEVKLSTFFPAEVGYPPTRDFGTTMGYFWTLTQRLPGGSLAEKWDVLDLVSRTVALKGLWARAQAVHSIPYQALPVNIPRRAWFNSTDPEEAEGNLLRVTEAGLLSSTESDVLRRSLQRFWEVLPLATCVLCHGDLTMDNVIWHDGRVTTLLDFEFAVIAPVQLDLNNFVKYVFGPGNNKASAQEINAIQTLQQTVSEIALPMLRRPEDRTLLAGYAILIELWLLEEWLAHSEGEGPIEQWSPLLRLHSLSNGENGYLASLLR